MSQFLPADFSRGDPNTVAGYHAVHGRPAAFEGGDGASYSVEIVCDRTRSAEGEYGAYLLFVRWRASDPVAIGHVETNYLAHGASEREAIERAGALPLQDARSLLDALLRQGCDSIADKGA